MHSMHWNIDMPQFFSTALASSGNAAPRLQQHADASGGGGPADTAALLQQFADRQELAENEQDLVVYRMCYFFQQEKQQSTNETKEAVISAWKTHQQQQKPQEEGGASLANSPETLVGIQQVYVTFWPAACLAGMIYILLQFLVFYRGKGNGIDDVAWTEESMSKHTAMLLCCAYAALAWTLSNGLVLNPKKDLAAGLC